MLYSPKYILFVLYFVHVFLLDNKCDPLCKNQAKV